MNTEIKEKWVEEEELISTLKEIGIAEKSILQIIFYTKLQGTKEGKLNYNIFMQEMRKAGFNDDLTSLKNTSIKLNQALDRLLKTEYKSDEERRLAALLENVTNKSQRMSAIQEEKEELSKISANGLKEEISKEEERLDKLLNSVVAKPKEIIQPRKSVSNQAQRLIDIQESYKNETKEETTKVVPVLPKEETSKVEEKQNISEEERLDNLLKNLGKQKTLNVEVENTASQKLDSLSTDVIENREPKYNDDLVLKDDLEEVLKEDFQEQDIAMLLSSLDKQIINSKVYIHYNEFINIAGEKLEINLSRIPSIQQFTEYVKEKHENIQVKDISNSQQSDGIKIEEIEENPDKPAKDTFHEYECYEYLKKKNISIENFKMMLSEVEQIAEYDENNVFCGYAINYDEFIEVLKKNQIDISEIDTVEKFKNIVMKPEKTVIKSKKLDIFKKISEKFQKRKALKLCYKFYLNCKKLNNLKLETLNKNDLKKLLAENMKSIDNFMKNDKLINVIKKSKDVNKQINDLLLEAINCESKKLDNLKLVSIEQIKAISKKYTDTLEKNPEKLNQMRKTYLHSKYGIRIMIASIVSAIGLISTTTLFEKEQNAESQNEQVTSIETKADGFTDKSETNVNEIAHIEKEENNSISTNVITENNIKITSNETKEGKLETIASDLEENAKEYDFIRIGEEVDTLNNARNYQNLDDLVNNKNAKKSYFGSNAEIVRTVRAIAVSNEDEYKLMYDNDQVLEYLKKGYDDIGYLIDNMYSYNAYGNYITSEGLYQDEGIVRKRVK